jgi:tagatose 6-phosphate kinase
VIVVVCLNPALDITHHVAAVEWGGVNRPGAVHDRPGGKGLNVARTLAALGADVLVTGLAGGITGAGVTAAIEALGVTAAFAPVSGETRRTFTVVDASLAGRSTTSFHEAGPIVSAAELAGFRDRYEEALAGAEAVVLSGSLPLGLPPGTYAGADLAAVAEAAGELLGAGAGAVVATLGPEGMLAVTADGCWRAGPAAAVAGNATGAGDAVAGEFRSCDYVGALDTVLVEQVTVEEAR